MIKHSTAYKPPIEWFEGLLDYFDARLTAGSEKRQAIGHAVGRQVIALHMIEMILKCAIERVTSPYGQTHNLHQLYVGLPEAIQRAAENKYKQILSDEASTAWDVARSVEAFLEYLGDDPIGDTRYFWEREHSHGRSIVFQPGTLRTANVCFIYCLCMTIRIGLITRFVTRLNSVPLKVHLKSQMKDAKMKVVLERMTDKTTG